MIAREIAEDEFMQWFEAKKLPKNLLEKNSDDKEAIVNAIEDGRLVLNEDNTLVQKLSFPVSIGDTSINELTFKFRVQEGELAAAMRGIKTEDIIGQIAICYVSVLTGQNKGIIRALDPSDSYLGKKIAAFFFI